MQIIFTASSRTIHFNRTFGKGLRDYKYQSEGIYFRQRGAGFGELIKEPDYPSEAYS